MRDIKFRAYSKSYKKMFDNEILERVADVMYEVGKSLLSAMGEYEAASDLQRGIYLPTKDEDLILMQYTGLKDKNDKEIYEGDIVKFLDDEIYYSECGTEYDEFENIGQVIYDEEMLAFDINNRNIDRESVWETKLEIIGNIYENQELLK